MLLLPPRRCDPTSTALSVDYDYWLLTNGALIMLGSFPGCVCGLIEFIGWLGFIHASHFMRSMKSRHHYIWVALDYIYALQLDSSLCAVDV